MTHADREHEKGHKHRVRIEIDTQQTHEPQLPGHRHQRAGQHGGSTAHAAVEKEDDDCRDGRREREVPHHQNDAVHQIADEFAEADDVDADAIRLLRADLVLERMREFAVVERLVGRRIDVQQRRDDQTRSQVGGHQSTDEVGLLDVDAQLLKLRG